MDRTLPWLVVWFVLVARSAVGASPAASDCDRFAADPAVTKPGVALDAIDAGKAVAACAAAANEAPDDPRILNQYGRALERAGRLDEATKVYQWAADGGSEAARAALARLVLSSSPPAATAADPERQRVAQRLDAVAALARGIANHGPRDRDDPLAVLAATRALAAWPGVRAIALVTDAESDGAPLTAELWAAMARARPRAT